eukprot:TRINITY_DN53427_c0_g1_i1.p1 TRINITY_DN53427_c0_g1~~TRINITY_DN53427_c0_g1_i1.p1  ORF type:complete len:469 (-),score=149.20 TRINITY_DN53427_c0_g1_i1:22-1398(-)
MGGKKAAKQAEEETEELAEPVKKKKKRKADLQEPEAEAQEPTPKAKRIQRSAPEGEEEEAEPPKKVKPSKGAEKAAGGEKASKKLTLKEKKRLKKALEKGQAAAPVEEASEQATSAGDKSLKVTVSGLPFSAKAPEIKKFFKKCGKVLEVVVLGRRLGKAVLTLADEAGLQSVLKMDGEKYGERWLAVSAKGRGKEGSSAGKGKEKGKSKGANKGGEIKEFEVFVAGFPTSVGEATLRKTFAASGEIDRFLMPLDEKGDPKGVACINFTSMEGMQKALELDQTDFCGETLLVRRRVEHKKGKGKGKGEEKGKGGKGKMGCRDFEVFVGGLPYTTEEAVIRKDFEECGEVLRFSMPVDEEGNHKGLAFISYADSEGMEKALAFHETSYGGVTIRVQRANAPRGSGFDRGSGGKASGRGHRGTEWKGLDGASHTSYANSQGVIVESTGKRQTFAEPDDEE